MAPDPVWVEADPGERGHQGPEGPLRRPFQPQTLVLSQGRWSRRCGEIRKDPERELELEGVATSWDCVGGDRASPQVPTPLGFLGPGRPPDGVQGVRAPGTPEAV